MSSSENNIYPIVKSQEETQQYINEKVDEGLNKERIREMIIQRDILLEEIKHYKKIKHRWNKIDMGIKISGGILIGITGVSTIIISSIFPPTLLIPPAVHITLGSLGILEGLITGGITIGFTERKKVKYKKRTNIIQSYLDKMYFYINKVQEDGIITLQEVTGFRTLLDEYKNEIQRLENDIELIDLEKLRHDVDKEVKKNFKKQLTEEMKENIRSQYHANLDSVLKEKKSIVKVLEN